MQSVLLLQELISHKMQSVLLLQELISHKMQSVLLLQELISHKHSTHRYYSKTSKLHQCIKFILFWNDTVHVSDGLSAHHQEFKTVHTATKQVLLTAS